MTKEPKIIEGDARPAGKPSKYTWNKVSKTIIGLFVLWAVVTLSLVFIDFITVRSTMTLYWVVGGPALLAWIGYIILD